MARAALGEWIAARAGGIRAARRVGVRLDHRARRAWWRAAGPLGNSARQYRAQAPPKGSRVL